MTIERQVHLYEVLIRFDAKGYKGSHVKDLERIVDTATGEVLVEREGDARPITQNEIGDLIGKANAAFIANFEAAVALRSAG